MDVIREVPLFRVLIAGVLLWVGSVAFAAGKGVSVTSDETFYRRGEKVQITLKNNTKGSIFLSPCHGLTFEVLEGDAYRELPPAPCASDGASIEIKRNQTHVIEGIPLAGGRASIRPIISYGVACRSGLPLEQSECKRFDVARGRYFTYVFK